VGLIDVWIIGLSEDDFIALLPMLRRAFASFDRSERRRLLDSLRHPVHGATGQGGIGQLAVTVSAASDAPGFEAAMPLLLTILGLDTEKRAT